MSAEDYAQVVAELKDLVNLRNQLVHHFIDHFDLWSIDGYAAAQVNLSECFARVDGHCDRLRHWATQVDKAKSSMLDEMQTPAFLDLLIDGRETDGTIQWAMDLMGRSFPAHGTRAFQRPERHVWIPGNLFRHRIGSLNHCVI